MPTRLHDPGSGRRASSSTSSSSARAGTHAVMSTKTPTQQVSMTTDTSRSTRPRPAAPRRLRRSPGDPRAGARDAALARHVHLPAVRLRRRGRPPRGDVDARRLPAVGGRGGARKRRPRRPTACPACCCSGCPATRTTSGSAAYDPDAPGAGGGARDQARACPAIARRSPTSASASTPSHGHCGIVVDGEIANDATRRAARARGRCRTPRPAPTSSRRPT